jgi:xanthine dehydrogenase YagS FAD-binding subunit
MQHMAIDEPRAFRLLAPEDLAQAIRWAGADPHNHVFLAGGGDLMEQLKTQWRNPFTIIDLKRLPGLRGLQPTAEGGLRIGALTRLAELAREPRLDGELAALRDAAGRVATPQIRNLATLGGNLLQDSRCSYYRSGRQCLRAGGDLCDAYYGFHQEHAILGASRCYTVTPSDLTPALVALDARVLVQGPEGARDLPLEQLFSATDQDLRRMHRLAPGEVLTAVEIRPRPGRRSAFVKYAARKSWDFALASAAVALELKQHRVVDARIVLGGVAAVPWLCPAARELLRGREPDAQTIDHAADLALVGADPLPGNRYKVPLARKAVAEALRRSLALSAAPPSLL